jgi:RNA polymerase sigma factor (TIGR02999 family)
MSDDAGLAGIFAATASGDRAARDRFFAALYDELRQLARRALASGAGRYAELSPTTLVHEVYAGMAERAGLSLPDRTRFLAYAARAMRGFVIDSLRSRSARKRGGDFVLTPLDTRVAETAAAASAAELSRLSDALDALAQLEPDLAQVVDLKFFCGFSLLEIAQLTGVSERTAQRSWEKARLLLFEALQDVE